MTSVVTQKLKLDEFLKLPNLEESPAWEFSDGVTRQKPMPKFRHSVLQKRLLEVVTAERFLTLPELRCTFGGRSIVPDVVVISMERITFNEFGEPEDDFQLAPDWAVEILSPDQSSNRIIDNLLHCLEHGMQLGWLIDPKDYSVLVMKSRQEMKIYRNQQNLDTLPIFNLQLTAEEIFNWLWIDQ